MTPIEEARPAARGPGAGPERGRHRIVALAITLQRSGFAKAHTRPPGVALRSLQPTAGRWGPGRGDARQSLASGPGCSSILSPMRWPVLVRGGARRQEWAGTAAPQLRAHQRTWDSLCWRQREVLVSLAPPSSPAQSSQLQARGPRPRLDLAAPDRAPGGPQAPGTQRSQQGCFLDRA